MKMESSPKEYKDPDQIEIDLFGDILEGEKAAFLKEIRLIDQGFDPNNIVEDDNELKILYGPNSKLKLSFEEWKTQKNLDKLYEKNKDDNLYQR